MQLFEVLELRISPLTFERLEIPNDLRVLGVSSLGFSKRLNSDQRLHLFSPKVLQRSLVFAVPGKKLDRSLFIQRQNFHQPDLLELFHALESLRRWRGFFILCPREERTHQNGGQEKQASQ